MSAALDNVLPFRQRGQAVPGPERQPHGGSTPHSEDPAGTPPSRIAPGLWLYLQCPGGPADAVRLDRHVEDRFGDFWIADRDGGAGGETRIEDDRLDDRHLRVEVGPWFADIEDGISGDKYRIPDTVEAKVIRRFLREVGVLAVVKVRRYSMASGLDFGPVNGDPHGNWSDREAEIISRVFPGEARRRSMRDHETDENVERWWVESSLYPHKRVDRSDIQSDYHDPGGFRVAKEYVLRVSLLLSEELEKLGAKAVR